MEDASWSFWSSERERPDQPRGRSPVTLGLGGGGDALQEPLGWIIHTSYDYRPQGGEALREPVDLNLSWNYGHRGEDPARAS